MVGYAELHAHSCWSLREGASTPAEMIARALDLGYRAMALTDHDGLYGSMEYACAAKERNLQAITGAEVTLSDGSHLTLLAATIEGYHTLCQLLSRAYQEGCKDSPRMDKEWLLEQPEGLIVLSGCRKGELSRLISAGDLRQARTLAGDYRDAFGPESFFVELQHHDVYGDTQRVRGLAEVAGQVGLQVVATGNAHYHMRERHRLQDVLVAIRHRLTLETSHAVRRPNSEFFLHHPERIAHRFRDIPRAIENTVRIAERCTFDLTRDLPYRLPDYGGLPEGASEDSFLRGLCERAFARKYGRGVSPDIRNQARARLDRELALIERHGLAGFFLVYWEVLELVGLVAGELHGRDPNLPPDERPVGRGRGSSVGSIVCYLIGLSHVDPVKNELFLDRFLNEELHSLPDIDLDFPRDIRDVILQRAYDHFGEGHAAMVASFPTYRFRNAVLDVGKVLGLPGALLARLNRLGGMHASAHDIRAEMRRVPELAPLADSALWRHLVELAEQLAGFPRHISQHVGGVVVSAEPIERVVPVEPARMEGRRVIQWDKDSVSDARFVKFDFLALGMLSAVNNCLDIIEETRGVRIDLGQISHEEKAVFDSIQSGDTMGVFQVESRAQIQTLPRTQPRNLDDLAVQVAIVRPGPIVAGSFHPYMERRARMARGELTEPIDYGHPELAKPLAPVLQDTLGHVLYQDQVLQLAIHVAGFTPGQADQLRRAMGRKRSKEAMDELAEPFYAGAARSGISREAAGVAFGKMRAFAAFGFPKSHAVAFALLAYESAWLRLHYPAAYYASLFNAQPMGFYSVEVLANDARRHGIEVLPPSINRSRPEAWPEGGDIRLGLTQITGLRTNWRQRHPGLPAYRIVREREAGGPYRSLYDLLTRARLSRETAEALIRAGALDGFGLSRRELLWQLGLLIPPAGYQAPLPLPTEQDMIELPSPSDWETVAQDLAATGVSRDHPMALVRPLLHEGIITSLHLGGVNNPNRLPQGTAVAIAGMVVTRQRPQSARGVMFMLLEDEFGLANVVIHPGLFNRQRDLARAAPFVIVEGTVDNEKSGLPNVVATRLHRCPLPGMIEAPPSHDFS